MTFNVANLSGTVNATPEQFHIHVYGSGPFLQHPWYLNDYLRTNLLAIVAVGVHLGYLIAALQLLFRFRKELRTADKVLLTGHSLGGATIEVMSVLSLFFGIRNVEAHSFGGPKPWWIPTWPIWWIISKIGKTKITWYVAGVDLIPRIPFWNVHLGHRIKLPSVSYDIAKNHVHGYDQCIKNY